MKIKDLKELMKNFCDEDEVAIEMGEELYDCYGYDDDHCRNERKIPTLVIAME